MHTIEVFFFYFLIILFLITLVGFGIYEYIDNKKRDKERRKYEEYIHSEEYRKKKEEELDRELSHYNSDYHTINDDYSYTPVGHTFNSRNDSFYDINSPECPYGIYYNF